MSTTFHATLAHINHTTSRAIVRTHHFLVDRSVARGGFDLGPAGGEYMLVSLGGCFTTHLLAAIRAREAPVSNVTVAVSGTLEGTPERFTSFSPDVSADCADAELVSKLITIADRGCQVMNTLRQVASIAITYRGQPIPLALTDAVA